MTWTYSGDPSSSDLDKVRFLVGDTDEALPLMQDEEINFLIKTKGSADGAIQNVLLSIIAVLAREVDYVIGPESVKASQRLANYRQLLNDMKDLQLGTNAAPSWQPPKEPPGRPLFDIGMHDFFHNDKGDGLGG
jgi:hypothetical protein